MRPLALLYEVAGLPVFDLPRELREVYGGGFGLDDTVLFANFVQTIDGVVAIRSEPRSNRLVSGDSEADRFVMGVLRASADTVLLGSGTLHGSPRSLWTAERAYPAASAAFAELRARLSLPRDPLLAVLSGGGSLDPAHPALESGALVLTTAAGAERLRGRLPKACEIAALPGGPTVDVEAAVTLLHERGHRRILSEAGPHVFGSLLAAGVVDELFLTVSPLLAGRGELGLRLGLVEGQELLAERTVTGELLSVRRHGDHLFLRHRLGISSPA